MGRWGFEGGKEGGTAEAGACATVEVEVVVDCVAANFNSSMGPLQLRQHDVCLFCVCVCVCFVGGCGSVRGEGRGEAGAGARVAVEGADMCVCMAATATAARAPAAEAA